MISDSPSGMSKGIRLVAAMPAVRKRKKASGWVTMPQAGIQLPKIFGRSGSPWPRAMSWRSSEPYTITTPMMEAPMAISAEIMRAAARWPPSSA